MAAAMTIGARSATDVRTGSAAEGMRSTKTVSSTAPSKKKIKNRANARRQAAFFVKNNEISKTAKTFKSLKTLTDQISKTHNFLES